jgi:hypothetical protein
MVPVGCLGSLVLIALFVTGVVAIVFGFLRSSWAYSEGVNLARHDKKVIEMLGEPIEAGWMASGSIRVSGPAGDAHLAISLSGPKRSGTLYVVAHKVAGQWQFDHAEVEIDGQAERIDLLANGVAGLQAAALPTERRNPWLVHGSFM